MHLYTLRKDFYIERCLSLKEETQKMPINDFSCFTVLKYDTHAEIHIDY